MKLSIVATLYQSAAYVVSFHQRASAAARQLVGDDYEIILVNDGSPLPCPRKRFQGGVRPKHWIPPRSNEAECAIA